MSLESTPDVIMTVGHGGRTIDGLVGLLNEHARRYLVDVRSAPYSRYTPEFSKAPLERRLQEEGFTYVFMGDLIGGRPDDPAAYDDSGHVNYTALAALPDFKHGLSRLVVASEQRHAVMLLCSELLPERCHRSKLIGKALADAEIPTLHVGRDDVILTQQEVMRSLEGPQLSLLPDATHERSRDSYRG